MDEKELHRLRKHYESLADEDLIEAHNVGPEGYRDHETWEIIEREYERRGPAPDVAPEALIYDFKADELVRDPAPSESVSRRRMEPLFRILILISGAILLIWLLLGLIVWLDWRL